MSGGYNLFESELILVIFRGMNMQINRVYLLNPELTITQLMDAIMERIHKLQAITCVCQSEEFMDYATNYLSNYFWLQSGLVEELKELWEAFNKKAFA